MIDTPVKQSDTAQPDEPAYSGRKVWWIVGGTLTGAVLLLVMAVAGVWIWAAASPEEWSENRSAFPGPVSDAEVDTEIGDIELEETAETDLDLRTIATWRGAQPDIDNDIAGGVFTGTARCDQGLAMLGALDDCRVDHTLGLPAGTAADVSTDVGDIRLTGLTGEVTAETSIGDVEGVDLRTTDLEVEASVGSVELEFDQVLGDIVVTASTGDVLIEVPDDGTTYAVQFESGVGEQHIDIATDPNAAADRIITVTADIGDLTVRYAD